jgi:hypothetical protein
MQTPHEFFRRAMRPQLEEIPFSRAEQYADHLLHELAAATSGTDIAVDSLYKEIFDRLYQLRMQIERPDFFGGVSSNFIPERLVDLYVQLADLGYLAEIEQHPLLRPLVPVFRDAANYFVTSGNIQPPTIGDYL